MSAAGPKVAVLVNAPTLPAGHPDAASEADVLGVAEAVALALRSGGFEARILAARPPVGRLVESLESERPDVVFNLIEGFGGSSGGESRVTALLELLDLPYTGCPPEAQAICRRKGMTKALLLGSRLPTAPWVVVEPGDPIPDWTGPAIVKPESEDASLGIDQASVVSGSGEIRTQVDRVRARYGPRILIESYLPGAEFNVGVVALPEPAALPVAEVLHRPEAGQWPILSYAAKWEIGSLEDRASPIRCPAAIEAELAEGLGRLATRAFEATGCRDLARVDFRLDAQGAPMILEVNPNPDLGPDAGWARALRASGREYGATLIDLARQAMARGPRHD